MSVVLVVAYNKNLVIGDGEKIPWHIPEEIKFFKEYTTGKTCIMGRKTWDSIPKKYKPLKNRCNIVVARCVQNVESIEGDFYCVQSVEDAIKKSLEVHPNNKICIIGGKQIYNYCIENNIADKVVASEIKTHTDVLGSVFFPDLKSLNWTRSVVKDYDEFEVVEYFKSSKTEFTLKLYDDESTKKKLETMNSLEVAFDDERNNVPDDYWKILEELKTGDSLRISIEKFGET
jgi:dihydrofolate reductase